MMRRDEAARLAIVRRGGAPGRSKGDGAVSAVNSFDSIDTLAVGDGEYQVFRIDKVPGYEKLPFSLKVLLENLLRTEDGANVTADQIRALGAWEPAAEPNTEIQFTPARRAHGSGRP